MSGVDSRTRTERLDSLRRQTKLEIASGERTHVDPHRLVDLRLLLQNLERELGLKVTPLPKPPRTKPKRKSAVDNVGLHLARLGVTSNDVKVWAVSAGLLDQVRRGRIAAYLVEAYEHAHPTERND